MFLNCPACTDQDGAVRCGLPAEVRCRFTMHSTDGPVESAMIRCPAGHCFSGAVEILTWDGTDKHDPGTAAVASRAGRDSLQHGHDDRRGGGGSAPRDIPAKPGRNARRPNTAPAYYLGHPAALWITAERPSAAGGFLRTASPGRIADTAPDHRVHRRPCSGGYGFRTAVIRACGSSGSGQARGLLSLSAARSAGSWGSRCAAR